MTAKLNWLITRFLLPAIVCAAIVMLLSAIFVAPRVEFENQEFLMGLELLIAIVVASAYAFLFRHELRKRH